MKRILSTFILALILAACGGGGSDDPATPAVVVLSEHRSAAGSTTSTGNVQQTVLQSSYTNAGSQSYPLRVIVDVTGVQAAPAANIDHAVVMLTISSGPTPLTTKVVMSADATKRNGNLVLDVNIPPGLAVDVKASALLIVKQGSATMTWDSMVLQLQKAP